MPGPGDPGNEWRPAAPAAAATGTTPGRPAGLPFRPAVLVVALLALVGFMGVIVVFDDSGGPPPSVTGIPGARPAATTPDGAPLQPVEIGNPAALAPPGGVPVALDLEDEILAWKTGQDWVSVLAWYYDSFPIDGMALDPEKSGFRARGEDDVVIGEKHAIIAAGATDAPGQSPYLDIRSDPDNPTGTIVSYHTWD